MEHAGVLPEPHPPGSDPCSERARGDSARVRGGGGRAAAGDGGGRATRTLDGVDAAGCTLLPPEGGRNDPGSMPWKSPAMRAVAEIFARAAVHRDAGVGGLAAAFLALSSRSRRAASLACRMKFRSSSSSSSSPAAARSSEPRHVGSSRELSGTGRNNVGGARRGSRSPSRGRRCGWRGAGRRGPWPRASGLCPSCPLAAPSSQASQRSGGGPESTGSWWCYKKRVHRRTSEGRGFSWLVRIAWF